MRLADLDEDSTVFIDANVFIYVSGTAAVRSATPNRR